MNVDLPAYFVMACNTAPDSENKMHDDRVAPLYGFRGGLVPGVTVYGYMTTPVVTHWGRDWLESGSFQLKLQSPVYHQEEVIVQSQQQPDGCLHVTAGSVDSTKCATGIATLGEPLVVFADPSERLLPQPDARPKASAETMFTGAVLGTIHRTLDLSDENYLEKRSEKLSVYRGSQAIAHPAMLLELSDEILLGNFQLDPWIHAASELTNYSAAHHGDTISVRAKIHDRFDRKGHEFVVLHISIYADGDRLVQRVRHTAIYRPRIQ